MYIHTPNTMRKGFFSTIQPKLGALILVNTLKKGSPVLSLYRFEFL